MNPNGKPPEMHQVDGREMTVNEIAAMLGISRLSLLKRRSNLGGASYQTIVNMYRDNQFGTYHDRSSRYMVDGRWMSRKEICAELGIARMTLANWFQRNKGHSLNEAIEHYRKVKSGEIKRGCGPGRPPVRYRVGRKDWSVPDVARHFGVCAQSVRRVLEVHGGDMAAVIKHYREREEKKKRKAERAIMDILGF
ncbi:MAG: hypothetical protein II008_02465 [Oscillospiraceae bacterium]|nr:hypothetical protein [Oscillospiraceae bacterium]